MGFKRIILVTALCATVLSPALAASAPERLAAALARPARLHGRTYDLRRILNDVNIRRRLPAIDISTIQFARGSARISRAERKKLADIAAAMRLLLQENPREVFLVEGHTDKAGSARSNLKLSEARARAVRQALVRNFGIPAANLAARGYGEAYPRILGKVREPRNRRVVFRRITAALKRLPTAMAARAIPPATRPAPFRPQLLRRQALPFNPPAARPPFLAPAPVTKPRPAARSKPAFKPWLMRTAALPFTPPAARPPFLAPAPVTKPHPAARPEPPFRPWLKVRARLPFTPPAGCPIPPVPRVGEE